MKRGSLPEGSVSPLFYHNQLIFLSSMIKMIISKRVCLVMMLAAFLLLSSSGVMAQATLTAKVYGLETQGRYYGRLYVPKGAKWRIKRFHESDRQVTVYFASVDGSNIYLKPLFLQDGHYWIDATATDHALLVRSTTTEDVVAEAVTTEQDEAFLDDGFLYNDASDAKRNRFRYAVTKVTAEEMKDNPTFNTKVVYVMANPQKNGLAFAKVDPDVVTTGIPKGSLYVLTKKSAASRLNVVFEDYDDVEEPTAIEVVQSPNHDDAIYNLQGVRVLNPVKGSLYIRNGRKYVAE